MTGWPPYRIARTGLARTFQIVKLFKDFTVRENVEVAAISATGVLRARKRADARDAALARVGISHLADIPAEHPAAGRGAAGRDRAGAGHRIRRFSSSMSRAPGLNDAEVEVLLPTLDRIRRERRLRHSDRRPRHAADHGALRPHPRAELRPHHRRRDAGRGAHRSRR